MIAFAALTVTDLKESMKIVWKCGKNEKKKSKLLSYLLKIHF